MCIGVFVFMYLHVYSVILCVCACVFVVEAIQKNKYSGALNNFLKETKHFAKTRFFP